MNRDTSRWPGTSATSMPRSAIRWPGKSPWPRYANPEAVPWGKDADGNRQTGGCVAITRFLDELIDFGYTGKDGAIVKARDAGDRYLKETLLPNWSTGSNWGYFFWDWKAYTLNCTMPYWTSDYILDNTERFPQLAVQCSDALRDHGLRGVHLPGRPRRGLFGRLVLPRVVELLRRFERLRSPTLLRIVSEIRRQDGVRDDAGDGPPADSPEHLRRPRHRRGG